MNVNYPKGIVWSGTATVIASLALILFSIGGYIAVRLSIRSIWLPLWLSVFELIRLLSYVVLTAGVLLAYLTFRATLSTRLRVLLVVSNVAAPLLLFTVSFGIESWFVSEGRRHLAESRAEASPVSLQPREVAGVRHLPALSLSTLQDDQVKIQDLIRGANVAVLVFWASYNSSWSHNLRIVSSIYEAHKSEGLVAVGINEQEPQDMVRKFISENGIAFPIVLDIDGKYIQSLDLPGSIEAVVVVDAGGRVVESLSRTQEVKDRLPEIVRRQLKDQGKGG